MSVPPRRLPRARELMASGEDVMDVEAGMVGMDMDELAAVGGGDAASVIDAARAGVVAFLADHRADEVVPENSRVIVLDAEVALASALRALYENGVRAAPVSDSRTVRYIGLFDVSDVIAALLQFRGAASDVLSSYTVRQWLEQRHTAAAAGAAAAFHYVDANASLLDACRQLRNLRVHRLPIAAHGSTVLCTLEHWRVLRFVHLHLAGRRDSRSDALFSMTLAQLGIGTFTGLVSVRETATLADALDVLIRRRLSAVPVVGEDGKLKDVYARADITALARAPIAPTTLDMSVLQALAGQRPMGATLATCRRDDSLRTIFETFERTRKHRLYAVDKRGVLAGVLSLSDVLAYFLHAV